MYQDDTLIPAIFFKVNPKLAQTTYFFLGVQSPITYTINENVGLNQTQHKLLNTPQSVLHLTATHLVQNDFLNYMSSHLMLN